MESSMFLSSRHGLCAAWAALCCLALPVSAQTVTGSQPPPSAPAESTRTGDWDIRLADMRLDRALQRWAQQAGYSLRWDADRYVVIGANARYTGNLEQAVEAVLSTPGIRASAYPLEACVYANHPPLIRITRLGDQTDECQ